MSAIPFYKSVYETHFLAGDSGRSRGLDHRAMPGAPVSYRLNTKTTTKYHLHQVLKVNPTHI